MTGRILDKHWPWQILAAVLFIGFQAVMWYMIKGFNQDFGVGFAIGAATGVLIALGAVGWRRGEHRS